ncbi:hypothetical protein ACFYYH_08210 [Streptomyces sp. NPDC002018]|uniref:hypothetical protein n=1 Tax=Streptomyces sp. NPDC002018 TaxID=3364629 RepID=UPI0036BC8887
MGNTTSLCATCGAEFVPTTRRRGRPDARFCTAACRALRERTHSTRIVPGPPTAEPAGAAEAVESVEAVESLEAVGSVEKAEPVEWAGPVEMIEAAGAAGTDAARPTPLPPLGTEHSCPHCGHQFMIVNFVLPSLDSAGDVHAAVDGDVRNRYSAG